MKHIDPNHSEIEYIENLMLEKFKTEPFHNLYILAKKLPKTLDYGGTCSDKTLSFLYKLEEVGIKAQLHSAMIKNQEIHRMVSVTFNECTYFADIGNGWPSIKLFPKDREIKYSCYGINYRSVINNNFLEIYLTRRGKERLSVSIPFVAKSQEAIMADIAKRFDGSIEYPFSQGLRFSLVVDDKFLFLRDSVLYIYQQNNEVVEISDLNQNNAPEIIKHYFNYDTSKIFID